MGYSPENEIKFFYDKFSQSDICGMFNLPHFITIILFFALLGLCLYLSRNLSKEKIRRVHLIIAIAVSVMEVIKIGLRVYKRQWYDSYIPLYFCSLFIFAVWLSLSKKSFLNRIGYSYITMGGILASAFFTFYPSTSLAMYPINHPSCFHSFIFHFLMAYLGVLFLMKKVYEPTPKDAGHYFIFIVFMCIPSYFINNALGTNCMFLRDAFKLPILSSLLSFSKSLYMLVVVLGQAVAIYWLSFGLYKLIKLIKKES